MEQKRVKKIYKGMADLRDYEVKKWIENGSSVEVMYETDKMTLTPKDLEEKVLRISGLFKSNTGGQDYHLYSYDFIPDKVEL